MRKTLIIVAVGAIVALFPLLALPPRMEAWVLLIIGLGIIIFGLYERIAYREKNPQKETLTHVETISEDENLDDFSEDNEQDNEGEKRDVEEEDGDYLNY